MAQAATPIRIDCSTFDSLDAIWQMITHVPDEHFRPLEVAIAGKPYGRVVRDSETGLQAIEPLT